MDSLIGQSSIEFNDRKTQIKTKKNFFEFKSDKTNAVADIRNDIYIKGLFNFF